MKKLIMLCSIILLLCGFTGGEKKYDSSDYYQISMNNGGQEEVFYAVINDPNVTLDTLKDVVAITCEDKYGAENLNIEVLKISEKTYLEDFINKNKK